ncbi:MAG: peptidylprolyl isomerase [Pseudomonadota bacterium]
MKKVGLLVICAAFGLSFLAGSCSSNKKGDTVAKVNNEVITENDLEFLGTINPRIKAQLTNPEGRQKLLDNMIEQELLYQEAVKQGINRREDVKVKSDLYRRVIISQTLMEEEIEKAAQKYYDENKDEFNKLSFSHIMVEYANPADLKNDKKHKKQKSKKQTGPRSEEEALIYIQKIKARLDKGEDFATVAKEVSEDVATKNRGGDLGLVDKTDQRLAARGFGPLLEKAAEIKVGEIAGPIKTNKGYHLITVTKGFELSPYDQAKNSIIFKVRNTVKDDLLKQLKAEAKISFPKEEKKAEAQGQAVKENKSETTNLGTAEKSEENKETVKN